MIDADSYIDGVIHFQRIGDCYFNKLSAYIDTTTIYTGTEPQNKAIDWLLEDSSESSCEDNTFVERYALAVINFAAPIDMSLRNPAYNETSSKKIFSDSLWIENDKRHCNWKNIACTGGSVVVIGKML